MCTFSEIHSSPRYFKLLRFFFGTSICQSKVIFPFWRRSSLWVSPTIQRWLRLLQSSGLLDFAPCFTIWWSHFYPSCCRRRFICWVRTFTKESRPGKKKKNLCFFFWEIWDLKCQYSQYQQVVDFCVCRFVEVDGVNRLHNIIMNYIRTYLEIGLLSYCICLVCYLLLTMVVFGQKIPHFRGCFDSIYVIDDIWCLRPWTAMTQTEFKTIKKDPNPHEIKYMFVVVCLSSLSTGNTHAATKKTNAGFWSKRTRKLVQIIH